MIPNAIMANATMTKIAMITKLTKTTKITMITKLTKLTKIRVMIPNAAYELLVALKCSQAGTALNVPQSDRVVGAPGHHQPGQEGHHDEIHVGRDS